MSSSRRVTRAIGFALASLSLAATAGLASAQCPGVPALTAPITYAPALGTAVTSIEHGDFDGDGTLDLVACDGPEIFVLRNQGAGVFLAEAPIPTSANLADVAVGDFDADGRLDVAAVGTLGMTTPGGNVIQGWVVILLNRTSTGSAGPVTFAPPAGIPFGPQAPSGSVGRALQAADLNADGILDLVLVDSNSSNTWVLLGHGSFGLGDGSFGTPTPYPLPGTFYADVAVGDFDHDGAPDLALIQYGGCSCPTSVDLLAGVPGPPGLPTGTFSTAGSVAIPGPSECETIVAVDIDGDGFLDLAIASYLTVEVAYGTGGFGFTAVSYPAGPYPVQLAVGDYSGDGLLDIAVARNCPSSGGVGNLSLLVGQPTTGFTGYNDITFSSGFPQCVTAGDFDGDGRLDIAVGRTAGGIDVSFATCPSAAPLAVTVTFPNGGELLGPGGSAPIVWSKSLSVPLVDVDLSRNGGMTWERIASSVAGTSLPWTVTDPGSANAAVRVSASGIPTVADTSDLPFTIGGSATATVTVIGPGCSPTGPPPSLTVGLPILGSRASVFIQGASAWSPGGLVASLVPAGPAIVSPGCSTFLDLGSLSLLAVYTTGASGSWGENFQVPNINHLAGFVIRAQAAVAVPGFGIELTNAVELSLGF